MHVDAQRTFLRLADEFGPDGSNEAQVQVLFNAAG